MTMDILRMQRRLQDVGVPHEQAEVFAEEIAHILAREVATKADLRELKNEMDGKFAEIENRLVELRVEVAGEINGVHNELHGIRNEITDGRNETAGIRNEITDGRNEATGIRNEIMDVRNEIADLRNEIADLRNEIANLRNEMADLKVAVAGYQANTAKWAVGVIGAVLLGFIGMTVAVILAMVQLA